jgi:hypothetical protein
LEVVVLVLATVLTEISVLVVVVQVVIYQVLRM